jgi:hypothetical protein
MARIKFVLGERQRIFEQATNDIREVYRAQKKKEKLALIKAEEEKIIQEMQARIEAKLTNQQQASSTPSN